QLGVPLRQTAKAQHGGGFYSYPTQRGVIDLFNAGRLLPEASVNRSTRFALLECEASGRRIQYHTGKLASTQLTPVRVLQTYQRVRRPEPPAQSYEDGYATDSYLDWLYQSGDSGEYRLVPEEVSDHANNFH